MVSSALRRSFETLAAAAYADGELSETERQVLHQKATEMSIPQRMVEAILERGEQGKLRVSPPPSPRARADLMNDLIDVVCADGRVQGPEQRLLAKFASHIGLSIADLRSLVRERLKRPPRRPRVREQIEEVRIIEETPAAPAPERRAPEPEKSMVPEPEAPKPGPWKAPESGETKGFRMMPPGPFRFEETSDTATELGVSPVTLGLLKQGILLETSQGALRYAERILGVDRLEAQRIITRILEMNPDLKPGSMRLKGGS